MYLGKADGYKDAHELNLDMRSQLHRQTTITMYSDYAYDNYTVGVKNDGSMVWTGGYGLRKEYGWYGIMAVDGNTKRVVGLKADGTVVAAGDIPYDVDDLTNIVAIDNGDDYIVGLKADGTVVATGYRQRDVDDWSDIVAITDGGDHTVGLKADGTVVATGDNEYGQCDVDDWTNIKVPEYVR